MKQPVWILNSSLLILFFMSQLLLFMLQRTVPRRISISPGTITIEQEQAIVPVDIMKIYQQDLFGTYEPPVVHQKSVVDNSVQAMPAPPKIILPEVPVEKNPTFFAPLDVVLKGVIFVRDDPASCIAIVQLKKTKEERNYQVGDLIEDAQILKILSNRIIIVRSNGQQETLYLREEDAISDFNKEIKSSPKSIVENNSDNKYSINIDEFEKRIRNLGEFINLLDLTTVYKQGKSFGCRVGRIDMNSLAGELGFMMDDIIVKVDDFYVDDLTSRIKLYDHIMQKNIGDVIEVSLYRGNVIVTLMYGLIDNASKNIVFSPQQKHQKLMEELSQHEAEKFSDENEQVRIQNLLPDDLDRTSLDDDIKKLKIDMSLDGGNIPGQRFIAPSNKIISSKIEDSQRAIQSLQPQTLNSLDMHNQRLMKEHAKMQGTLEDMKFKDKNNMMRRSSKNVIFNGMQQ